MSSNCSDVHYFSFFLECLNQKSIVLPKVAINVPNNIFNKKFQLIDSNIEQKDINKYFLSVLIFVISLFVITSLLSIFSINFEDSFKIGILTLMNTVNSNMFGLSDFNFGDLNLYTKITLMLFMIIGRVELLTILIIVKKFLFKN